MTVVAESDQRRYLTVERELGAAVQVRRGGRWLWVLERAGINRANLVVATSPATTRTTW